MPSARGDEASTERRPAALAEGSWAVERVTRRHTRARASSVVRRPLSVVVRVRVSHAGVGQDIPLRLGPSSRTPCLASSGGAGAPVMMSLRNGCVVLARLSRARRTSRRLTTRHRHHHRRPPARPPPNQTNPQTTPRTARKRKRARPLRTSAPSRRVRRLSFTRSFDLSFFLSFFLGA